MEYLIIAIIFVLALLGLGVLVQFVYKRILRMRYKSKELILKK